MRGQGRIDPACSSDGGERKRLNAKERGLEWAVMQLAWKLVQRARFLKDPSCYLTFWIAGQAACGLVRADAVVRRQVYLNSNDQRTGGAAYLGARLESPSR